MSEYGEQIRSDLERFRKILQKYIGGLFRYSEGSKRMNRYIDADEFEDELYEHEFSNWCDKDEVSELIDNMPSADVVKVVRCKDCKYWNDTGLCKKHSSPIVGALYGTDADDYCSEGKRKERQ